MSAEADLITISDYRSLCVLHPELGGSIMQWVVDEQPMLRASQQDASAAINPMMLGSFPLVPYSNRIGNAQFKLGEQTLHLSPNFHPEPHAIHGVGWTRPWSVKTTEEHYCTISLDHEGDSHWPFAFTASQRFELCDGALKITSTAINRADQPVPLAFGHHPYFDQRHASLRFNAKAVLVNAPDALPMDITVPCGQFDFGTGGIVAGRDIDHCYADWDGYAEIRWEDRPLALQIHSDMQAAVVYIPSGGAIFCFEPVPHVNNALNRPDLAPAMPVIQPGASFVSTIIMQAAHPRSVA